MTRKAPTLLATFIGAKAKLLISSSETASVMGNTSRGIFLKTERKWVIFLSFEDYRGPMTINLQGDLAPLKKMPQGGLVQLTPSLIFAPKNDLQIAPDEAVKWKPTQAFPEAYESINFPTRLETFAKVAYAQKNNEGLSGLLPHLLGISSSNVLQNDDILIIQTSLREQDLSSTHPPIENLLGLGSGLTPSGDDFIIGLLLTLNRWDAVLKLRNLPAFNKQVIEAAYVKTTTLSATLIECAADGQADERLVTALDYLMTGIGEPKPILDDLLSWGNSSGVDALVGMVVALRK